MDSMPIPSVVRTVYTSHAPYSNGVQCNGGGCPAVYLTDQGSYLVVGRRLSAAEKASLSIDAIEDALEIPADLLSGVLQNLNQS